MAEVGDLSGVEVIAPNLKRRVSGVTASVRNLLPLQSARMGVVTTGPVLDPALPHVALHRLLLMPRDRLRVWHARRNNELLLGLLLRDLFRRRLRVVFTSSSPRVRSRWTQALVARCDALVATSRVNAGVMPGRPQVIPHGVDTGVFSPGPGGAFGPAEGQRRIGCFGRIRPAKGTAEFVEAMVRLLPDRPGWVAVVMGHVSPQHRAYADALRDRVQAAGLEGRILFLPPQPVTAMPAAYRDLSIYVAPSHYEGFGLTPLEAMACGVPVVATRGVGTFDEQVVDGVTGRLVPPGDAGALAAALARMMDDDAARAAMGRAARDHVCQRFSVEGEAEALLALYRRLLAGG
jgi:mannosyltransferase